MVEIDAVEFKEKLDKIVDEEENSTEAPVIDLLLTTIVKAINESMREHEDKYHMGDVK